MEINRVACSSIQANTAQNTAFKSKLKGEPLEDALKYVSNLGTGVYGEKFANSLAAIKGDGLFDIITLSYKSKSSPISFNVAKNGTTVAENVRLSGITIPGHHSMKLINKIAEHGIDSLV